MAKLALSRGVLGDYSKLDTSIQRKVDNVFAKFEDATHAGIHLEKMQGGSGAHTVKIDQNHRGIVVKPEKGDTWILLRLLPHRECDKWIERNRVDVNATTGALEVVDVTSLREAAATLSQAPEPDPGDRLFEDRAAKDFIQLGVSEELVPLIQRLSSEDEMLALTSLLPQGQADALTGLAAGLTPEEVWAEVVAGEDPGEVDTSDVETALTRSVSKAMFYVVEGSDELVDILNQPFAAWRTFLHPTQRRIAYKDTYNGPARVTGGAGTGKTVVAMHRAKALADGYEGDGKPILFTTFTRNLAQAIVDGLRRLGGPELVSKVDVVNVDRLAHRIVREVEAQNPKIADDRAERGLWEDVVDEEGFGWTPTFLRQEWHQVVLSQGITSRDEYFAAPRPGRGVRLSRRQRAEVWKAIEAFNTRLLSLGLRTYLQLADEAAGYLEGRAVKPYEHVVVDEAQDLHPAQWRMLRAVAPGQANDLFLVGDTHQRIYDNRVTLSKLGINVRGRSRKLRLNYRTTHEIMKWSLGLLSGQTFDDLDEGSDTFAGYRSWTHGPEPTVQGYDSQRAELDELVAAVKKWIDEGVEPADIGVAARTSHAAEAALRAFEHAGMTARQMAPDDTTEDRNGVQVGTMHRMKGLEFRCVAVVDVGKNQVPHPQAITPEQEDQLEHEHDIQRERCLLYVACTRARDDLRVSWHGAPSSFVEALR